MHTIIYRAKFNKPPTAENWDSYIRWPLLDHVKLEDDLVSRGLLTRVADLKEGETSIPVLILQEAGDGAGTLDAMLYVPRVPIQLGIQLVSHQTNTSSICRVLFSQECESELPWWLSAWAAGCMALSNNPVFPYAHGGVAHKLTSAMEWIKANKETVIPTGKGITGSQILPLLRDKYRECLSRPNASTVQAYITAVETMQLHLNTLKNETEFADVMTELQSASKPGEVLRILQSTDPSSPFYSPSQTELVVLLQQMNDTHATFPPKTVTEEGHLLTLTLKKQEDYECLRVRVEEVMSRLRGKENTRPEIVAFYEALITKSVQCYLHSKLKALQTDVKRFSPSAPLVYDVSSYPTDDPLGKLLMSFSKKSETKEEEKTSAAQALAFCKRDDITDFNVAALRQIRDYTKRTTNHHSAMESHAAASVGEAIRLQREYEKKGKYFEEQTATLSMKRHEQDLDFYIGKFIALDKDERKTFANILRPLFSHNYKQLTSWGIHQQRHKEVVAKLDDLSHLLARVTSLNVAEVEKPFPLKYMANFRKRPQEETFRSQADVSQYLAQYRMYRVPDIRKRMPFIISELDESTLPAPIAALIGTEYARTWNDQVFKPYDDTLKELTEAHDRYEETVERLKEVARTSPLLGDMYSTVISACHRDGSGLTEIETWWHVVDEILTDVPELIPIRTMPARDVVLKTMLKNKWPVYLESEERDEDTVENWTLPTLLDYMAKTCKGVVGDCKRRLAKCIHARKAFWAGRALNAWGAATSGFPDVIFEDDKGRTVTVKSEEFDALPSSTYALVDMMTSVYEDEFIAVFYQFMRTGETRWCAKRHVGTPFSSTFDLQNPTAPETAFETMLLLYMFYLYSPLALASGEAAELTEGNGSSVAQLLTRQNVLYGRTARNIQAYSTVSDPGIDLYELLVLPEDEDIPLNTLPTDMTPLEREQLASLLLKKKGRVHVNTVSKLLDPTYWVPNTARGPFYQTVLSELAVNQKRMSTLCLDERQEKTLLYRDCRDAEPVTLFQIVQTNSQLEQFTQHVTDSSRVQTVFRDVIFRKDAKQETQLFEIEHDDPDIVEAYEHVLDIAMDTLYPTGIVTHTLQDAVPSPLASALREAAAAAEYITPSSQPPGREDICTQDLRQPALRRHLEPFSEESILGEFQKVVISDTEEPGLPSQIVLDPTHLELQSHSDQQQQQQKQQQHLEAANEADRETGRVQHVKATVFIVHSKNFWRHQQLVTWRPLSS